MAIPRDISRSGKDEFGGVPWNGLVDLCAMEPIDGLTPIQRVAHLAFWYMSEVNNGGHFQYFYNQSEFDHSEVVAVLRQLGAVQCAAILEEAITHLKAQEMRRPQSVEEYTESESEADMMKLDMRFYQEGDSEFQKCMVKYLEANESEFIRWVE